MFTTYDLQQFLNGIATLFQWGYWGTMLLMLAILVPIAFHKGESHNRKIFNAIGVSAGIIVLFVRIIPMLLIMALGPSKAERQAAKERQERYKQAEALFKQQCEKAGEKIYRTVDDVEGILLLNIVPKRGHADWSNPNWEYAALMKEFPKEGYIHDFLRKKRIKVSKPTEQDLTEYIPFNANPADYVFQNGYQFIDVLQDNKYYRYTVKQMPSRVDFNIKEIKKPVRYAVKFETHNHPEYRKYWVAGVHFSIIDTWDNTILAEKTIYSFEPKQGGPNYGREPWLNAVYCPYEDYQNNLIQARFFVDKVLKPRQIQERKNDNVN